MAHIPGHDRSQLLLLPEAVDDYVAADNPVRFIEAFVDGLDLAALGFIGTVPKATGRPGYAPADLLKLYIYGYLNRVRSSRRLEAETHRNIEVIWLLRHLKPDFKTIADFRRINHKAFRPVFRQFVLLCKQLDLFGRALLAVDGTRIRRSTTRTAISPVRRWPSSSDWPIRSSMTTCNGSTMLMQLKPAPPALGSRTWRRRSPRSGVGVNAARRCWRSSTAPEKARSR